ncbi:MAG: nuclear transport factor 2 family protein [Ferruginibacter sp.]
MKQIFFTLFCCLLFVGIARSQQADQAKLIQTIKAFHQSLVNKNTASINQQTNKALTYGHSNGWVETKAELIKHLETGFISYASIAEDSIKIEINDNIASARFIAVIKAAFEGKDMVTYHLRVLEVWTKKRNKWVLFTRQAVPMNSINH